MLDKKLNEENSTRMPQVEGTAQCRLYERPTLVKRGSLSALVAQTISRQPGGGGGVVLVR
jgi:hypothetical protein